MGKITGFLEQERISPSYDAPESRVQHYKEFVHILKDEDAGKQGSRCMDCGIHFVTTAVRSTTSFPILTTWCTSRIGKTRSKYCH